MAGAIQQIQQDLIALESTLANLAQGFEDAYQDYLTALGEAVRKQLILACYHLCTQGYPEAFLKLSFSQRQKFQQDLQYLAQGAQTRLNHLIHLKSEPVDSALSDDQTSFDEEQLPETDPSLSQPSQGVSSFTRPEQLAQWQEQIESGVGQCLSQLSKDTNFLVQEFNIFTPKLPEAILEVASQAETNTETVAGSPNLLTMMIETEDHEKPQTTAIARLMAIHLRLSEIEFADATVMTGRHQVRHLSGQLNQLQHDFNKKLQEKAVLEAESAWRSSWFEIQS